MKSSQENTGVRNTRGIGAEKHDEKQAPRNPGAVGEESRSELQLLQAAALRDPGPAKAQMTDRDSEPDQKAAQTGGVVENLVDLLLAHGRGKESHCTQQPGGAQGRDRHTTTVGSLKNRRGLAAVRHGVQHPGRDIHRAIAADSTEDRITAFMILDM